jgi:lipoate-protein ligase B
LAPLPLVLSSPAAALPLTVRDLGRVDYAEAVALQDVLAEQRLDDAIPDTLLLLEHPPVITLGRRASMQDIFLSEDELRRRGISVHRATRGGLVTYHGPGQLVGYPIVKLRARGFTVPCYVRVLELAIIDALSEIGITATLRDGYVGVFTEAGKVAAIGVHQRHGVTLHGFAINLQPDVSHFNLINPCGIGDLGVTSAAVILGHPIDLDDFKSRIVRTLNAALSNIGCTSG